MTRQIGLRLTPELLAEIDEWRKQIRPMPSQGAAVRELVIEGLSSIKRKVDGKKPKRKT